MKKENTKDKSQSFLKGAAILGASVVVVRLMGMVYKILLSGMYGGVGTGLFNSAYATGQSSVTVKCANSSVYNLMLGELIDGNKIFDYLESGTSNMSYYVNEDLYIITFIF